MGISLSEVAHRWDTEKIMGVFLALVALSQENDSASNSIRKSVMGLDQWNGDAASTAKESIDNSLAQLFNHVVITPRIKEAFSASCEDIAHIKKSIKILSEDVQSLPGLTLDLDNNTVILSAHSSTVAEQTIQQFRERIDHIISHAHQIDITLAQAVMFAIPGDTSVSSHSAELLASAEGLSATIYEPMSLTDDAVGPLGAGAPATARAIPLGNVDFHGRGTFPIGRPAMEKAVNQALDTMAITDRQARGRWLTGMLTLINRESTYNSNAINNYDINARGPIVADGYPAGCSRGPAQCTPSTFARFHQPGTSTNIYNPVANIAASMNYMQERYHVARDARDLAAKVPQANPAAYPHGY